jgi:hypothetical protein
MKLYFLALSICLSFSAFCQGLSATACPGCQYDSAQFGASPSPFAVGLFPDSIVITQDAYVDTDVTYLLPQKINTGISVAPTATVINVTILGVNATTPLPTGIHITCNKAPSCSYDISAGRYGCVKICGITAQAATNGWVEADISVAGTGSAAGTTETQNQNIKFYYKILPDTSACHTVCFVNKIHSGCDSATIGVEAGIDIACAQPILNPCTFDWNFGNGTSDSNQTLQQVISPQYVTYNSPGVYPVTLSAYTGQLVITGATFTVPDDPKLLGFLPCATGCAWYNNICNGDGINPGANDFHLNFTIGSSSYSTSGAGGGNLTGTYTGLNYPVTSQAVAIDIEDHCELSNLTSSTATTLVTGPGTYTWSAGSDGNGTFTVSLLPMDSVSYTDSVYIYASPDSPVITLAADTACQGDSVLLSIDSSYAVDNVLWFKDSTNISGASGISLYAKASGLYTVTVTNPATGCKAASLPVALAVSGPLPYSPLVYYYGAGNEMFIDGFITGQTAVWYYDSTVVPGHNGEFCPIVGYGSYYAVVYPTGFPQCGVSTNAVNYTPSGINEVSGDISNLRVYPNPNNGAFTIKVNVLTAGNVNIKLTDVLGRVVYENTVAASQSAELKADINVAPLTKGIYTLEVTNDQGVSATKKVVID